MFVTFSRFLKILLLYIIITILLGLAFQSYKQRQSCVLSLLNKCVHVQLKKETSHQCWHVCFLSVRQALRYSACFI